MNALELADFMQSKYDLFPKSEQMQVVVVLRKQDAAIKQLRAALVQITEASSANLAAITTPLVNGAQQALAATEEFAK